MKQFTREQGIALAIVAVALLCFGGRLLGGASGTPITTKDHRIIATAGDLDVRPAEAAVAPLRADYAEPATGGAPFVLRNSSAAPRVRLPPPPPFVLPLPPPLPLPER